MNGNVLEVAIVADDLTGALDMAAPFAARGFPTQLLLDPQRKPALGDLQVLTLTSASRDLPLAVAETRMQVAMQAALACRPRLLISKIDSALRGNVAEAILGGLRTGGRRHALVAVAIPGQGRTMRDGEVYVNGVPLRENLLGLASSSLPSAPLPKLLRSAAPELSVHTWRRGEVSRFDGAPGLHAYVADCETEEDLDKLARFAIENSDQLLVVGASGLGKAIASQLAVSEASRAAPEVRWTAARPGSRILFVIGSCTYVSAGQMTRLLDEGAQETAMPFPVPPDRWSEDTASIEACGPLMLLRPARSMAFDQASSEQIAEALGNEAATLVRRLKIKAVVVSGGDTALAVFRALGVAEARLLGELLPGVAVGSCALDGEEILFVTKSGSFGSADTLVDTYQALRGGVVPWPAER